MNNADIGTVRQADVPVIGGGLAGMFAAIKERMQDSHHQNVVDELAKEAPRLSQSLGFQQ